MKMSYFRAFLWQVVMGCLLSFTLQAQTKTVTGTGRGLQGRINNNYVIGLRWMPVGDTTTANSSATNYYLNAWTRYRANGYTIERRRKNSTTIERTVTILPDSAALSALALSSTSSIESEASDLLYGALYEPIELDSGQVNGQAIRIEQGTPADEQYQRYTLTALGAEMSFRAAQLAGLGWIDSTVSFGIHYEYRIREAGISEADTAVRSFVISAQAVPPTLVLVYPPRAKGGNKEAMVEWRWRDSNNATISNYYKAFSSYFVEKAPFASPIVYTRVNTKPLFPFSDLTDTLSYRIPLDTNGVNYYVKIVGRTPFDEEINSAPTSVKGVEPIPYYSIRFDSTHRSANNQVYLHWVFPADTVDAQAQSKIRGFILRQSSDFQTFQSVTSGAFLSASTRQFTLNNVTESRYYMISAVTVNRDTIHSVPVFVDLPDDTPPAKPRGLLATWQDSTKTIKVTWSPNTETDLLGYKLLHASLPNEEPSVLADSITTTTYIDTLIKMDNRKAYYYLVAYDKRYNHSEISDRIELKKPDKIAPARPVFSNYGLTASGSVSLSWVNSASIDVASYRLTRKPKGNTGVGSIIKSWTVAQAAETYMDSSTQVASYTYYIQAIDSTNNMSADSIDVEVLTVMKSKPSLDSLVGVADTLFKQVALRWVYDATGVVEFQLLKAEGTSEQLSSWKIVDSFARTIFDDKVALGKTYSYAIRAVFSDGTMSNWKEITVAINP